MPRGRRGERAGWGRYAAPVAFLAAATVAIVLVASALRSEPADESASRATTSATAPRSKTGPGARRSRRYYTVVAGDTFGTIARKTGTSVARLERLNRGVSSTSLHVGQRIRLR